MTIAEKVAYIKGLVEGSKVSSESKEGKVLAAIIDVLEDIAYELQDLDDNQLDIGDELDALSDDLADVEEFVYGPECCEDDDCCCGDDDEELSFEVTCPECDADIAVSEEDLDKGEIVCPSCGEKLEFEFDGFEDEEEEE